MAEPRTRFAYVRFALARVIFTLVLVFAASSGAVVLTRLAPGDAASELVVEGASMSTIKAERARLGINRSIPAQYWDWARRAVRLDFGTSFRYQRPVGPLVAERAANTALLALTALVLATVTGLPLGVVSATRPRSLVARLVRFSSVVGLSIPPMLLSLAFTAMAARTGWFPVGGMRSASAPPGVTGVAWDVARHLVLPALALALPVAALLERLQSRALSATLDEPCLAAAAARGISSRRLRFVHALRLSITPVAALYGMVAGGLLGGSFAVEIVTAWPGLGRLMYEALVSRDLYLVAGCAAIGAAFVGVGTLASDLFAAWNDPRLREDLS
jgi:peptide/nickel transport system permease protein